MRFTCCLCTCSSYAQNHPILHQRRSLSVLCLRVWQKLKNSPRETNFLCHSPAGGNGWFEPSSWLGLINELNFLEFRLIVQCSGMQKIKFKKKLHFEGLAWPSFVISCIFHIFDDIMSRHVEKTPSQSVEWVPNSHWSSFSNEFMPLLSHKPHRFGIQFCLSLIYWPCLFQKKWEENLQ